MVGVVNRKLGFLALQFYVMRILIILLLLAAIALPCSYSHQFRKIVTWSKSFIYFHVLHWRDSLAIELLRTRCGGFDAWRSKYEIMFLALQFYVMRIFNLLLFLPAMHFHVHNLT